MIEFRVYFMIARSPYLIEFDRGLHAITALDAANEVRDVITAPSGAVVFLLTWERSGQGLAAIFPVAADAKALCGGEVLA